MLPYVVMVNKVVYITNYYNSTNDTLWFPVLSITIFTVNRVHNFRD